MSGASCAAGSGFHFGWVLAVSLLACNMNVTVDPDGHRCSNDEPCPTGYACIESRCRQEVGPSVGGGVPFPVGGGVEGGGRPPMAGGASCSTSCDTPPSASCEGNKARSFGSNGICQATGCTYPVFEVDCAPGACVAGRCGFTATQTGPRLRFAVNAVDVAPGPATAVLFAGNGGQLAAWNGSKMSVIDGIDAGVSFSAVSFVSPNVAWAVGTNRAVARYDRTINATLPTPAPPLANGNANLIGVDGTNENAVLVADGTGNWAKWTGNGWTSGTLPTTASGYLMRNLWVDETGRERIVGSCLNAFGFRRTCTAYRWPGGAAPDTFFVDTTQVESRPCVAVGPWIEVPSTGGQDALCGFADNGSIRHTSMGDYATSPAMLTVGEGIVGITGGPAMMGNRPVWVLTSSNAGQGRLYRLGGTSVAPTASIQLDTFLKEEHLSPTENGGVIVAEVDRPRNVNNVLYRRTGPDRTEAIDLGFDIAAVTVLGSDLALVSSTGELAIKRNGADVYEFRRPPGSGPALVIEAADGRNASTSVLAVGKDGSNSGLISRVSTTGYARVTTTAPMTTFKSLCRLSEEDAVVVGTGGAVFFVSGASATKDTSVATTSDLLSVDCASTEILVCGTNSALWRKSGASPFSPVAFPMPNVTLNSCKLLGDALFVAGNAAPGSGVFAQFDLERNVWSMLPSKPNLGHLITRAPNDILGLTTNGTSFDVVRFDGATWTTVLANVAGMPHGGVNASSRVVWGGTAGVLIEGR